MIIRFTLAFSVVSLAFSLVSFGRVSSSESSIVYPWTLISVGIITHMVTHALFGAFIGLPSRNRSIIAIGAIAVIAIDFDHMSAFTGLEFASRTGHSPFFMVLAWFIVWRLARWGIFNANVSPIALAGIAAASIPAHMAFDVASIGGEMPLMAPFSYSKYFVASWAAWPLLGAALLMVWLSSFSIIHPKKFFK